MKITYKILSLKKGKTKKGESYYRVLIYANWSDVIFDCYVSKDVYEAIEKDQLTDDNIGEYISFSYYKGKIYLSCDIK